MKERSNIMAESDAQSGNALRAPLARARGLGAARRGAEHWLAYRLLAGCLGVMTLLVTALALHLSGADHAQAIAVLGQPWVTILLLCFMGLLFHHAAYGMQEIYEDYLHHKPLKLVASVLTKALALLLFLIGAYALLKIAFGA
jgi:succinate dehydrogenase / fumarate reductase, membrane anchor subunit